MKRYVGFIKENIIEKDVKSVAIYDEHGTKIGIVPVKSLPSGIFNEKSYTFAALSDIHITFETGQEDFERALRYLNGYSGDMIKKIDFICICGDIGVVGNETEWNLYKSFIDNYSPDTDVHFATGNHDADGSIRAYDSTIPYTGNPIYYSFTKGDDIFIMFGMSYWGDPPFSKESLQWLYEILETNRNKRCFVFQHVMRLDGCGNSHGLYPRDDLNNTHGSVFRSLLEHYKNVVWFHGHTHTIFELQSSFPIANYDRLYGCHSIHIPSLSIPKDINHEIIYPGSQGYIVDVYENGIHLKGRDFSTDKFLSIASYWIDTTPIQIAEKTYIDSTGTINI